MADQALLARVKVDRAMVDRIVHVPRTKGIAARARVGNMVQVAVRMGVPTVAQKAGPAVDRAAMASRLTVRPMKLRKNWAAS